MRRAVTGQTELRNAARDQQTWIRRTMRRMTRDATFGLHRRVFVNKWALLVCVTLDAGCVGSSGESGLFKFETAVRIVAIAALHSAFEHLVMERQVELVLGLAVTIETKLWFARPEQFQIREAGLLCVGGGDEHVRSRQLPAARWRMGRVTVNTADVVTPVLSAAKIVVFLSAGVTSQTGLRALLRRHVFEGNDLRRITFFDVCLAWTMA